jgi:hypothetical protein
MIFLEEGKTGMETIRAIVSCGHDAFVHVKSEGIAVPIRLQDAKNIIELYNMSGAAHQCKLDRLPFVAIMEIYITAFSAGIVKVLTSDNTAPNKKMWH